MFNRSLVTSELASFNINGTLKLFEEAKKSSVKIIFISSISAFEQAKTIYGLSKLEIERWVLQNNGVVIRPGLVWGDRDGGMMGTLKKVINKTKIVPIPGARQLFFTCHIEDLTALVIAICNNRFGLEDRQIITAAAKDPTSFVNIMRTIGLHMGKKKVWCIPIPWRPLYWGLCLIERLGIKMRLRSDSLLSMMNMNETPDLSWITQHKIHIRAFE